MALAPSSLNILGQEVTDNTKREIAQANRLIANVLYSTSYIERWGSDVKRITDACAYRNVETPTWTTDGYFVAVTFKRPDYNANVPKDVPKDDTKDNTPIKSDWCFVALAERLPKGSS